MVESFETYASEIVRRNMRVVAIVSLAATVLSWPFDAWYHPGSVDSLLVFRITGVVAPLVTLLGLRTSISGTKLFLFVVAVCVALAASLGYAIADAREVTRSWLGLEALPFMTIMLPWPLPQRLLATSSISIAFIVASLGHTDPDLLLDALAMIPYFIAGTSISCVFGHAMFRLLSDNFANRGELAARALALEESDRRKSEVIATIVSQRTEELRGLAAHLEASREGDRARISHAIQEEVSQVLAGVRMELAAASRQEALPVDLFERLDGLVAAAMSEHRDLASDLRPQQLDDLGLYAAVESYVERMRGHIDIALTISSPPLEIEQSVAVAVFRILEDAVAHAVARGGAAAVTVELGSEAGALVLTVEDDAPGADQGGYGVLAMRERAAATGGVLEIARHDHGTRARLVVPLAAGAPR